MNFKTKKLILGILAIAFVLSLLFFRVFLLETSIGRLIFILFLIAYVALTLFWWRCPCCGSYFGKMSIFATHCPFCGEELE